VSAMLRGERESVATNIVVVFSWEVVLPSAVHSLACGGCRPRRAHVLAVHELSHHVPNAPGESHQRNLGRG